MSKGAKPGQNRFAGAQKKLRDYRVNRIKEEVLPRLKSLAGKISFDGVTPFSRFCAQIYNDGLPVNEKHIGYRTFVQSSEYWALVGPIYHKHWDTSENTERKKDQLICRLATKRADDLKSELERLKLEVEALKAALRNHGAPVIDQPKHSSSEEKSNEYMLKFDKTCRALKLVLDASEGTFAVDLSAVKITCAYNDLEPAEGLAPKEIAEPFISWIKAKGNVL